MNQEKPEANTIALKSERLLEGLFEFAPDAIVVVNQEGKLERVNNRTRTIFGYEKDELVGKQLEILIPERFRDKHPEHRHGYMASPHLRTMGAGLDLYGQRKDGSEMPVDIMLSPLETENGKFVIAIIRDITERKKLEEDKEILAQQREDFVATLTHDLKTPVIAANRALKLLLDGDFGEVPDQQRDLIETILDSNNDMYLMVRTLLDVYKYDSGTKKLTFNYQDFGKIVNQIYAEFKPLTADQNVDLRFELPEIAEPVHCDLIEIKRVFENLLSNALKYTTSKDSIVISVTQEEGITNVKIIDTGKGITEEDKAKLFQRFWQAEQGRKYYASTGLGLYLCRRIIEMHGGEISCASVLGKGSTFEFAIPTSPVLEGDL